MDSNSTLLIILLAAGVLVLVSFGFGVFCLIRYARTRKKSLLLTGLLLTLILPGLISCLALIAFIPAATVVYAPPPPDYLP